MAVATTFANALKNLSHEEGAESPQKNSWLGLLCAAALLFFADGRDTIALASWLAPALLLRFVRTQPAKRGLLIAYLTLVVTRGIAFRGMTPIPGVFYYIFLVISNFSALLPYFVDRLAAPRFKGVLNTLVFPCTLVTAQFIYSHGPIGSWGSIPYTQAGNLPLLQLLSVTGLWGLTFLMGWFAGAVNWTWQQEASGAKAWRPLGIFAGVYVVALLLGGARLVVFSPAAPTVRIASLSPTKGGAKISDDFMNAVTGGKASAAQISEFRAATSAGQDDLLKRSEREATAGAKIVFWSETAAYVLKQDEPELLTRGRALAAKYHIYLGMALGTWTQGSASPLENKFVMIEPTGVIAWQYWKARPTPGPEMAMSVKSDGRLRQVDTAYGKVDAAICYDTDFPHLMMQAGAQQADLVLSPASDWKAIDPRHTEIASFRAIEQGFNLVRQSNAGLSAAFDYQGRRLASMDEYQAKDLTMIAEVPTSGVRTIYSVLGDWLAWLCIAAILALIGFAWRNSRRAKFA
jgi:apolipoprotein N-acyltransferase